MSTDCYQTAYERTIVELAEIDEQLQMLIRRKELLENLLEPLRLVAAESSPVAPPAEPPEPSLQGEDASPKEVAPIAALTLVDVPEAENSPVETPARIEESEEPGTHTGTNGRVYSQDEVANLAYRFWSEGGRIHGRHEDDWFRAAQELQNSA